MLNLLSVKPKAYQMSIFNFFTQVFSKEKQKELEKIILKLDSSFESATVATILSSKKQKVIFPFYYIHANDYENINIADELNDISLTQGIEKKFEWNGFGSMYAVVRAYNDFLISIGYRFIYWMDEGLYNFVGFIVKEEKLYSTLDFAKKNDLIFQPILGSDSFPSWFKRIDKKQDLKALIKREALIAKKLGKHFFLYSSMEGCRPCEILDNNITLPEMLDTFKDVYIVKIDILHNLEELSTHFKIESAPIFTYITPEGTVTDYILDGDAWGNEDTVENISATLKTFFRNRSG